MERRIKVNILTSGRFHVLDLARELDKNGFDVLFYSFVPSWRAKLFGLPRRCVSSIFWIILPLAIIERKILPGKRWIRNIRRVVQDQVTGCIMRKADVTIAMSGSYMHSTEKAKAKGSLLIVERGSKHIYEQKRILEAIPSNKGKKIIGDDVVIREIHDYDLADYIAIASSHVRDSFLIHHYPAEKMFLNPYGVDVSKFHPIKRPKKYDLIMVGNWSYQKGCDLIASAVKDMNLSFIHVGKIGDLDFPNDNHFTHIDAVEQSCLVDYYNQAKVFVLPSRQDGFGMVFSQALACNLPIVGSTDSGAPDLKKMIGYPEFISIIKDYTVDSVVEAIQNEMTQYEKLDGTSYAIDAIPQLSWDAYGKRYSDFLRSILW